MQNLIIFLVIFIIFLFSFSNSHMMQKTRDGKKLENFETVNSQLIPQILANYLRNHSISYSVYKIPNYVRDLFKYHKNFSIIYSEHKKYSIILFVPSDKLSNDYAAFKPFYDKISEKVKEYPKTFNLISFNYDEKSDYKYSYDKLAYTDLQQYCDKFCFIDPTTNLMFTFNKISNSEVEALDVLFQQYAFKQN